MPTQQYVYRSDIESFTQLRKMVKGFKLLFGSEPQIVVRGTFRDIRTNELVFSYGWCKVTAIGYKYLTIIADGKAVTVDQYDSLSNGVKFDAKFIEVE